LFCARLGSRQPERNGTINHPRTKRRYTVSGKVSLLDPDWVPVEGNAGEFNFFRVSVEMR
jgi:hypothetical protein